MKTLEERKRKLKMELLELSNLAFPDAYAYSNEEIGELAKEVLSIINELQKENKKLKTKNQWLPIETYKKGKAVFYYPSELDKFGDVKLPVYIEVLDYLRPTRQATHWLPLPTKP